MTKRWIKLLLVFGLIAILAACTGSEPAATPTPIPPVEEESEDQATAESEDGDSMEQEDTAEADEGEEETTDSPPAIDAAALFDANCARCHGADRVSGGAPDLVPDQLTKDREVYIGTITNGSGPMPAWGSQLSADEINALVDFILSTPE